MTDRDCPPDPLRRGGGNPSPRRVLAAIIAAVGCLATLALASSPAAVRASAGDRAGLQAACSATTGCVRTATPTFDAAARLAEQYAPILYLPLQPRPCSTTGDPYSPVPVTTVLGNPRVVLIDGERAISAPTARDLAMAGTSAYLDLPGNPLDPGCTYERDFRALPPDPPTAYARVLVDPARPGVALQYWFFYYFNGANNTHEGDWEMFQLSWDVASVEEALNSAPSRVAFAQHKGGQSESWDDSSVHKEESHPVVFVASGSHAAYFEPDVYLRTSLVGCDHAAPPFHRVAVTPILLPTQIEGPDNPFAWLTFEGRWGENAPGRWAGSRGPNMSPQWTSPFAWERDLRSASIKVGKPTGGLPGARDGVCAFAQAAAWIVNHEMTNPVGTLVGLSAAVIAFALALVSAKPILVATTRLYLCHGRLYTLIGLGLIPLYALMGALWLAIGSVVRHAPWLAMPGMPHAARVAIVMLLGGIWLAPLVILVTAAAGRIVADVAAGREPSARRAARASVQSLPMLADSVRRWSPVTWTRTWRSPVSVRVETVTNLLVLLAIGAGAAPVLGLMVMLNFWWSLDRTLIVVAIGYVVTVPFMCTGATILFGGLPTSPTPEASDPPGVTALPTAVDHY